MVKSKKKHHGKRKVEKAPIKAKVEASEENIDYSVLVRLELLKLQRQYRLMDGTRHAFAEESGTTISRQHRIMEFLHAENESLEIDYKNASCPQNIRRDEKSRSHIAKMMLLYDNYQTKIKHWIATIEEMESQVDKITKRVVTQNLKIQQLFGVSLTPDIACKKLRTLENRLYHMTTRYDTLVSQNHHLRSEINTILMERARYHKRSVFIKRSVANMKKRMMEVVDAATVTYESRDELHSKMRTIRERNDKESRQHVLELKEWQRLLHGDEKDHAFLNTKYQDRDVIEKDEDRKLRHDKTDEDMLDYTLMQYKNSFKDIFALGKISDIDSLCHYYMDLDQKNFTQFKYISDINNEIEVLRTSVDTFKTEIQDVAKFSRERRVDQIDKLEKQKGILENVNRACETLNDKTEENTIAIRTIFVEIEGIFTLVECSKESIQNLLGGSSGVTSSHAHLCISLIDQKLSDLQTEIAAFAIRKAVEIEGRPLPSKQTQLSYSKDKVRFLGGPYKPRVIISGRMDTTEEDGEEDKLMSSRPLSYEELKLSILERQATSSQSVAVFDELSTTESVMDLSEMPSTMSIHPSKANEKESSAAKPDNKSNGPPSVSAESPTTAPDQTTQPETNSSVVPPTTNPIPQAVTESPNTTQMAQPETNSSVVPPTTNPTPQAVTESPNTTQMAQPETNPPTEHTIDDQEDPETEADPNE